MERSNTNNNAKYYTTDPVQARKNLETLSHEQGDSKVPFVLKQIIQRKLVLSEAGVEAKGERGEVFYFSLPSLLLCAFALIVF